MKTSTKKAYIIAGLMVTIFVQSANGKISEKIPVVRLVAKQQELVRINMKMDGMFAKAIENHTIDERALIFAKLRNTREWRKLEKEREEIIKYFENNKDKIDSKIYNKFVEIITTPLGYMLPVRVPS